MGRRAVLCLLLVLTLAACRSEPEEAAAPPPPVPAAQEAALEPAADVPKPTAAPDLTDVEPDAFCEARGREYERRGGIWIPRGSEGEPVSRVVDLEPDPELEKKIAWYALESSLKLGPTVRAWMDGELVEIRHHDLSRQYEDVVCETRGKVRLPRNLGPMGTALEEQLRRDNWPGRRGIRVEFVVERDGRVSRLLSADVGREYKDLLLQDLQAVPFQPATLDGRPVAVVHTADLSY